MYRASLPCRFCKCDVFYIQGSFKRTYGIDDLDEDYFDIDDHLEFLLPSEEGMMFYNVSWEFFLEILFVHSFFD